LLNSFVAFKERGQVNGGTFGELRKQIEAEGTWENTAILVSAITGEAPQFRHAIGKLDHRVGLFSKLPLRPNVMEYQGTFNTLLPRDLLPAVPSGKVRICDEAARQPDAY
jgi:hypothetical protein